jgi:hypothetical protein
MAPTSSTGRSSRTGRGCLRREVSPPRWTRRRAEKPGLVPPPCFGARRPTRGLSFSAYNERAAKACSVVHIPETRKGVMASHAQHRKQQSKLLETVKDRLGSGEVVIAVLPFASTPKRPKGPSGKVRDGIYTSYRHYRPLVVTSRRLLVINAARTPFPRGVLAEFPLAKVRVVDVVPARFGQSRLRLDLPEVGTVPFDLGRYDVEALPELRAAVENQ